MLDGKEVYAFSPSSITVVEGDTLRPDIIDPEDDAHSFVLPDFAVSLPGGTATQATYVAKHAGIFAIQCAVPSHLPMIAGQLIVLPAVTMADVADARAQDRAKIDLTAATSRGRLYPVRLAFLAAGPRVAPLHRCSECRCLECVTQPPWRLS